MAEVFSSSLCQNNLTKTIAQINDFLFIYMKLKAMDHSTCPAFCSTQRMVRLCMSRTAIRKTYQIHPIPFVYIGAAPFTVLKYLEHCSRTVCNGVHTLF